MKVHPCVDFVIDGKLMNLAREANFNLEDPTLARWLCREIEPHIQKLLKTERLVGAVPGKGNIKVHIRLDSVADSEKFYGSLLSSDPAETTI